MDDLGVSVSFLPSLGSEVHLSFGGVVISASASLLHFVPAAFAFWLPLIVGYDAVLASAPASRYLVLRAFHPFPIFGRNNLPPLIEITFRPVHSALPRFLAFGGDLHLASAPAPPSCLVVLRCPLRTTCLRPSPSSLLAFFLRLLSLSPSFLRFVLFLSPSPLSPPPYPLPYPLPHLS